MRGWEKNSVWLFKWYEPCFCYFLFNFTLPLMSCAFWVVLSDHHCSTGTCLMLYHISFNYSGKKAADTSLTCSCHLSNSMPDSIFYDCMGWAMTLEFFKGLVFAALLNIEKMDSVSSLQYQWVWGNLKL